MHLKDVPGVLGGVAELAAGDAGRKTEVANGDFLVNKRVGKIVGTLGHSTDKDTNALVVIELVNVVPDSHDRRIETEGDLAAFGGQVVGNGVLDDAKQLLLGVGGLNGEAMEQLHHETGKALEGTRDAHRGGDLDQHTLGGGDVNLKPAGLVDGRVEQGE